MAQDPFSLAGKIALVTGSGRENGIGAAIAYAFARHGASVAVHHVSASSAPRAARVAETVKELGGNAVVVRGDVTKAGAAQELVQDTLKGFGVNKIDILVNNAGGPSRLEHMELTHMSPQTLHDDFALNYFGPVFMMQAVIPHMSNGGRIINVGSIASHMYVPTQPAYAAAKAALDHSTRHLAGELGKNHSITVNVVAPGPIVTDILLSLSEGQRENLKKLNREKSKAADRMGEVDDIADVCLFVASEKSRWMTGHVFPVGGGLY